MARLVGDVEVAVPASAAWRACRDFEAFPSFIAGLHDVVRLRSGRYRWWGQAFGIRRRWDSELVAEREGECIAWRTDDGMVPDGRVIVESLGPDRSRVSIELRYSPADLHERLLDRLGVARLRLHMDLAAFRRHVEDE